MSHLKNTFLFTNIKLKLAGYLEAWDLTHTYFKKENTSYIFRQKCRTSKKFLVCDDFVIRSHIYILQTPNFFRFKTPIPIKVKQLLSVKNTGGI